MFAFIASVASKVRASLARLVRAHGHSRWAAVGRAATLSAAAGRNVKRLSGTVRLPKGLYRLTLTPASGAPRALTFRIR